MHRLKVALCHKVIENRVHIRLAIAFSVEADGLMSAASGCVGVIVHATFWRVIRLSIHAGLHPQRLVVLDDELRLLVNSAVTVFFFITILCELVIHTEISPIYHVPLCLLSKLWRLKFRRPFGALGKVNRFEVLALPITAIIEDLHLVE